MPPNPPHQPTVLRVALIAAAASAIAAVLGGLLGGVVALQFDEDTEPGGADAVPSPTVLSLRAEVSGAIAEAATHARQSVVRIEARHRGATGTEVGSGVLIDNEGHIVTNAHVVAGADSLRVFLADGSEQPALLLGHDAPFTDIAVLQITPGAAPPLEVGDSAALTLGEPLIAIGNPLSEFAGSVTVGVVSGLNRGRTVDGRYYADLIQTDAALNSGNSGGALVNLAGQFIGMPTLVVRESASQQPVEGIGFALPAQHVMEIGLAMIAAGGPLERPTLGVQHMDLTPEAIRQAGLPEESRGALIMAVAVDGPADAAGIHVGDVIQSVAGATLGPEYPLLNALLDKKPGELVTVVLDRNGSRVETQIRLGRRS